MTNFHELGAHALLGDMLRHPDCAPLLAETREKLRREEFSAEYVRVIAQADSRGGQWPMEQVAAFLAVHACLNSGRYARVDIELLERPAADKARGANAAVLGDLPPPFSATLDLEQNCSPAGDGTLVWREPIVARRSTGLGQVQPNGALEAVCEDYLIDGMRSRGGIPLEVGSTKASVTLTHLTRFRAVARWPYGSTVLTVLLDTEVFGPLAGAQRSIFEQPDR